MRKIVLLATCFIFNIIMFQSCKKYSLSEDDLAWLPYEVNDLLIYESNKNEIDSILITEISQFSNPDDPLAVFPNHHESLFVSGVNVSNFESNDKYTDSGRVEILKMYANKINSIEFNLNKIEDTKEYSKATFSLNELDKLFNNSKESFLDISIKAIKIETDETYSIDHDLQYIYWNKRFGYMGYEFKDGYYWKLKEFIRNGKNILN